MNKRFALAVLISLAVNIPAYAQTIFSCTTSSGKKVQVTEQGNSVNYRFGKTLNRPEISINVPISHLKYNASYHRTIGAYVNALGIPSGSYTYVVYDGMGEDGNQFGSLAVYKGSSYQPIAEFSCRSGYVANIGSVSDRASYDDQLPF